MIRPVAHRALRTRQENGCISSSSSLTISAVLTKRTSALRVADNGSGLVFVLAWRHEMHQSSYGVKTVRCASGPDFVCPSSCCLQDREWGLFMNHRLLRGSGTDVFHPPRFWCQLNTQQRIVIYRERLNEIHEMERRTHAHAHTHTRAWDRDIWMHVLL